MRTMALFRGQKNQQPDFLHRLPMLTTEWHEDGKGSEGRHGLQPAGTQLLQERDKDWSCVILVLGSPAPDVLVLHSE